MKALTDGTSLKQPSSIAGYVSSEHSHDIGPNSWINSQRMTNSSIDAEHVLIKRLSAIAWTLKRLFGQKGAVE